MLTLLVDNYDSYTFNLFQLLAKVNGRPPIVVRNDSLTWDQLRRIPFDNVVISPGPGRPDIPRDFGLCRRILEEVERPILGVCLGHQGLGLVAGGRVVHAPQPMHGRLSRIDHDGEDLFSGLPQGLTVVRYHSLCLAPELPETLLCTARADDGVIMGIRHHERLQWGVQFHPESVATKHGEQLIANFRDITRARVPRRALPQGSEEASRAAVSVVPRGRRAEDTTEIQRFRLRFRTINSLVDGEGAFLQLYGDDATAFWLDTSAQGVRDRHFSLMGNADGPHAFVATYAIDRGTLRVVRGSSVTEIRTGMLDWLDEALSARRCEEEGCPFPFVGGFVGYLGYEIKAECGARRRHRSTVPDAAMVFADRFVVLDHRSKRTYVAALCTEDTTADAEAWIVATARALERLPRPSPSAPRAIDAPAAFRLRRPRAQYLRDIGTCLRRIRDGETYEVCLTNQVHTALRPDPVALHRQLRRGNPSPYAALLRFGDVAVVCSSPERFLTISPAGHVETKPIKGTRPRGSTPEEDRALAEDLRSSEKDRAENLMIVDLLRNDLGVVCEVGSVEVPALMQVESYATVHQLVSTVRGRLRPGLGAVDCLRAAFPGGSMTGAPKRRTMEIIDELEGGARGVYSGTIGYFSLDGATDLNIVIRTAVISPSGTSIGTGGAIVALSDPEAELDEIMLKARSVAEGVWRCFGGDPQNLVVEGSR